MELSRQGGLICNFIPTYFFIVTMELYLEQKVDHENRPQISDLSKRHWEEELLTSMWMA